MSGRIRRGVGCRRRTSGVGDRRSHTGTASLELVIITPFLLALLMLIVAFARYAQTENLVDQTARDATRAATAQNDRSEVDPAVEKIVETSMDDAPESCRSTAHAEPPQLTSGAFEPGSVDDDTIESVTVTVTCRLDLGDLAAIPLQTVEISRTFTSPLDRYRGYQ